MTHFVTFLITLRVVFCPLFCGAGEFFASSPINQDENQVSVAYEAALSCCHHCPSEPIAPVDGPTQSSPDCNCFCHESAIVGVKVCLDDWSSAVWETYLPHYDHYLAVNDPSPIDSSPKTRSPQILTGRSLRLTLASLLI